MIISSKMWAAAAAKAAAAQATMTTTTITATTITSSSSNSKHKSAQPQATQQQQQGDKRAGPVLSSGASNAGQFPWVPRNPHLWPAALPTGAGNNGDHAEQQQQQQSTAGASSDQLRMRQARELDEAFVQLQTAHEQLANRLALQDLQRVHEVDTSSSSSSSRRDGTTKCGTAHRQQQQQHSNTSIWSLAAAVAATAASTATAAAAAARRERVLQRHREAVQVFEYRQSLQQQGRAAVLPTGVLGRAWWAVQRLLQTELYM
jgi:hypothetical protein